GAGCSRWWWSWVPPRRGAGRGSVDEVDGVDGPRIDGGAELLGELAVDGLVEVQDDQRLGATGAAGAGDLHDRDVDPGLAEAEPVGADQARPVLVADDQQVIAQRDVERVAEHLGELVLLVHAAEGAGDGD